MTVRAIAGSGLLATMLLVFLVGSAYGSRQGSSVSVAAYRAHIHHLRVSLDRLSARGSLSDRDLRPVIRGLTGLARVRLPGGGIISTDAPGWAATLRSGTPSERHEVVRQIDSLDTALGRTRTAPMSRADSGRLDTILRQARFQHGQSLADRIQQWLGNLLLQILQTILASNGGVGPVIRIVFAVLLLGLVAGITYLLARRSLGQLIVEVSPAGASGEPVTSTAAAERASDLVAFGDYRAALRYLYLATLLQLQERQVFQLRPGMTNRDYVRLARTNAAYRDDSGTALSALTHEFDRAWYGHLPFGAGDYARCEDLARRALAAPLPEQVA